MKEQCVSVLKKPTESPESQYFSQFVSQGKASRAFFLIAHKYLSLNLGDTGDPRFNVYISQESLACLSFLGPAFLTWRFL